MEMELPDSTTFYNKSYFGCFSEKFQYGANTLRGFAWSCVDDPSGFLLPVKAIVAVIVGTVGQFALGCSHRFQTREWTYWKGEATENTTEQKIMHLNVCMFPGFLPQPFGGQKPASARMETLKTKVNQENPDILFLCEFSPVFSKQLFDGLKDNYAHFFVNIGSCAAGMDASLSVVTKTKLIEEPKFVPSKAKAKSWDQWAMYRGFFIIKTEKCNYLYTHLHAKDESEARKAQLKEIQELTKNQSKPWVIVADLNIDRNKDEYKNIEGYTDVIQEEKEGKKVTCQEGEETESIDYILTPKDSSITFEQVKVELDLSLSDHATITATYNA